jgi:hypothetical protein
MIDNRSVNSAPSAPTGASHNPNYVMTDRPVITDPDSSGISGMPSCAVSMLAPRLRPFEDDSVITSVPLRSPAQPKQEHTDDSDATIGLGALRISFKGSARERLRFLQRRRILRTALQYSCKHSKSDCAYGSYLGRARRSTRLLPRRPSATDTTVTIRIRAY